MPIQGPLGPINPASDKTYDFMAKLFNEIYDVFPDNFVHLGGDELHTTCWYVSYHRTLNRATCV